MKTNGKRKTITVTEAAAWLHDVAKPQPSVADPGRLGRRKDHGRDGAVIARRILAETDFPRAKVEAVADATGTRERLAARRRKWQASLGRAFDRLRDKEAVGKLFGEIGPRYKSRPGGYLRILKCGYRPGDKAPMAYVELVDRPIESDDEVEAEVD